MRSSHRAWSTRSSWSTTAAVIRRPSLPGGCRIRLCTCIPKTAATAATRRPATAWRSSRAPTSLSWFTRTTSTTPRLIPAMGSLIASGLYACVLGSRILGGGARKGGMPLWKYVANRGLTWVENVLTAAKLSEYHTGYRAFPRELLEKLPLDANSDDFVFDNQVLAQVLWLGYVIAEVSCPTLYFPEASSINFRRSVKYGLGCLSTAASFRLAKLGLSPLASSLALWKTTLEARISIRRWRTILNGPSRNRSGHG